MQLFLANLHSFIIYSYVGTAIILVSAYLFFKVMKITSPKLKTWVYFSALIIPPLTYFVQHLILKKPCTFGTLPWDTTTTSQIYNDLCQVALKFTDFLVPFFVVAMVIGTIKGLISIIACRRLGVSYGYLAENDAPQLFEMLNKITRGMEINLPRIILLPSQGVKAFTFGITKPVIVISDGLLQALSEIELEHVLKHECAHIKRHDVLTNWLAVIIRDISFFNPFVQWAFSLYVTAKEEASDDMAVQTGVNTYQYGATLIKMWRKSSERSLSSLIFNNISPNPGFLKKAATFEKRVSRMLNWESAVYEPKFFNLFFGLVLIFSIAILTIVC